MTSRRDFLRYSSVVTVGFTALYKFAAFPLSAADPKAEGYGPLLPDPDGILELPKGFSYNIVSRKGTKMTDGFLTPGAPDGMAAFSGANGRVILIRNHEVSAGEAVNGAFGINNELLSKIDPSKVYDLGNGTKPALGGTTTLIFNENNNKLESDFISLAGTIRNCSGGPTPWKSWLTCEENVDKAGDLEGALEKDHGFVFEVPATLKPEQTNPVPLKAMGRFNHEAVAVDPRTSIVYLTEDRPDGLIYRFIPNAPEQLIKGGKLQVLAIRENKSADTRNWEGLKTTKFPIKEQIPVIWLDIDEVESPQDDLRKRGFERGAARFARGEGMWFGKNEFYFACTSGGVNAMGQIFRYIPSPDEGRKEEEKNPGKLELYLEPNNIELLKSCDNLTIAPWGDLVVCEDDKVPFLVGITPSGTLYKLAKNVGFQSEFAGAVFSPSGKTLFVNIQGAGLTLAITGPWQK